MYTAYSDVLKNFEILFKKYWSDCPFRIYLNIDEPIDDLLIDYDKIVVSNHKQNLIRMRYVNIETPYVIMMQDDYFIFDKIDNEKIIRCIDYAEKYDCGNLRLIQDPKTDTIFNEAEELLIYNPGKAYRISARGGLWKTIYLKKFIDKYDDFWQMEQQGQIFSCSLSEKVLCTKYRTLPIVDAVHKGYYEDFAIMLLETNGIEPSRTTASGKSNLRKR